MKHLAYFGPALAMATIVVIAYTYNILIGGNGVTFTFLTSALTAFFVGLTVYHFINRFNREAGIVTWWQYTKVMGTSIVIITLPLIFTFLGFSSEEIGLLQLSKAFNSLRFWSIPVALLLVFIYNITLNLWRDWSAKRHFDRD